MGIHLGAGNADQAHVSTRVTIGFGSKYKYYERNTCQRYQLSLSNTLLALGLITFLFYKLFFSNRITN